MKNNGYSETIRALAPYLGLSTKIVVSLGLFAFIGYRIDLSFETQPLWTLVFSFFGCFMALYAFIKELSMIEKRQKNKK